MNNQNETGPYNFGELASIDYNTVRPPESLAARDGTLLKFRHYPADANRVVVALHGSSAEGSYYNPLATPLSTRHHASVYVLDLRGHGLSGGRRGDVDYIGQLEDDLADVLKYIRQKHSGAKLVLLGHSSGGGLAVRYAGSKRDADIHGYVLLAPFLGATVPTTRPASGGWTTTDMPKIIELAQRAARGDTAGQDQIVLRFTKPLSQRTGREVLEYSFRMMISYAPRMDLGSDLSAIHQPLLVMAGEKDESFIPEQYEPTIAPHAKGTFKVLPGVNHLGVVVNPQAIEEVDAWLTANF